MPTKPINYRVSEARNLAGLTQQEAADGLDMTLQGYQYYEYGKRDIKASIIRRMCSLFGCSATFLLGLDDSPSVVASSPSPSHRMPLVGRIAAGTPREAIYQAGESHDAPEALWQSHPNGFWLTVSGNSMNRLFSEGTLVLIDPDEEVRNGDVGVVFVNGDDATLKRVYYDGETVRLHPESYDTEYVDRVIDRSDPDAPAVRVVGKAVSYTAPDGWRA